MHARPDGLIGQFDLTELATSGGTAEALKKIADKVPKDINVSVSPEYLAGVGFDIAKSTTVLRDLKAKMAEIKQQLENAAMTVGATAYGAQFAANILAHTVPMLGAPVGGALAALGPIGGAALAIYQAWPWFKQNLWQKIPFAGTACEFNVRGRDNVHCEDFAEKVQAAMDWANVHRLEVLSMTPVQMADQFGIFITRHDAIHSTPGQGGMGPDAIAMGLGELPEAYDILRIAQVPTATILAMAAPKAELNNILAQLPRQFPALIPADIEAIRSSTQRLDTGGRVTVSKDIMDVARQGGKDKGTSPILLATVAAAGGFALYAYTTKQSIGGAARTLVNKTKRVFFRR